MSRTASNSAPSPRSSRWMLSPTSGWMVSEGLGRHYTETTREQACQIPVGQSNDAGWRCVFSGDAVHAPTVAREHGCEGVADYLPQTAGCAELMLFLHDDGEAAAYFVER